MRVRSGGGLITILLTVAIITALATMSMKSAGTASVGPTSSTMPRGPSGSSTTVPVRSAALAAECSTDVTTLANAVGAFNALNSASPITRESNVVLGTPSTYARGAQAVRLENAGVLSSWPGSSSFAISLSTTSAGLVALYVPAGARRSVAVGPAAANACTRLL